MIDWLRTNWQFIAGLFGFGTIFWGLAMIFKWIRPIKITVHGLASYTYDKSLRFYLISVGQVEIKVRSDIITDTVHLQLKAVSSFYPDWDAKLEGRKKYQAGIKDMTFQTFLVHEGDLEAYLNKSHMARLFIGRAKSKWFLIDTIITI